VSELALGFVLGFIAGVGVTAAGFLLRRSARAPVPAKVVPSPDEAVGASVLETMLSENDVAERLRQDLRVKLLYDEAKVNAAIEFERERAPGASEEELIKAAIFRWERENR
jgi:hypothetical protein